MKRYNYIIEAVIFAALVLVIGYIRNQNPAFIGVHLHPFYLVVLLLVLRYGYVKGLFAMLLTAGVYLGFYMQQVERFQIEALWGDCYQPLAFIAFGIFAGLLAELDKKKIFRLNKHISELEDTVARKDSELKKVMNINERISEQLTSTDQTFNILFERTRKLFSEDIQVIREAAYEILMKTVQATKAYVFYLEGDEFKLACPADQRKDAAEFLKQNQEKVEQVRSNHEFVKPDERSLSEESPVFMGPVLHQESNTIYGMLAVERIDFLRYNATTFLTFVNLCKWLGEVFFFHSEQFAAAVPVEPVAAEFNYLVQFGASREDVNQFVQQSLTQ